MLKKLSLVASFLVIASVALSVPPGKKIVYECPNGNVTFDGTSHKSFKCSECHPSIFKMKAKEEKITMKSIYEGKYCGACHNGNKAFAPQGNCKKCHK